MANIETKPTGSGKEIALLVGVLMLVAAATLGTYLLLARTWPIAGLAPLVALLSAALVGVALGFDARADPLVPALQQPILLTAHVGSAVIAYAVAGVAFIAAAAELGQRAAAERIALLPPADVMRAVGHRAVLIGFPILTLAIVLGSVWANLAWRSYWSNDPKELAAVEGYLKRLAERAIRMEGTCTGEHGVGQGKSKYLKAELGDGLAVMRAIKAALDPHDLFNPGKILPG